MNRIRLSMLLAAAPSITTIRKPMKRFISARLMKIIATVTLLFRVLPASAAEPETYFVPNVID